MRLSILLIFVSFVAVPLLAGRTTKLTAKLEELLLQKPSATVQISFHGPRASQVLSSIKEQHFQTRAAKLNGVASLLKANALESQEEVTDFLARTSTEYKVLWISNQIVLRNASRSLIEKLSQFQGIAKIQEEGFIPIFNGVTNRGHQTERDWRAEEGSVEWGIGKIQAPEAWAWPEGGNNGTGVIVGSIDTGVRYTHEALVENYRGAYGWFDPYEGTELPLDWSGHGTHTMGTIVGRKGIGVAPGAQWMSCRACTMFQCSVIGLIECGQFMACPTLADGSGEDCSQAPHVVSNSWGYGPGETEDLPIESFYDDVLEAWAAADTLSAFSIGNGGELGCALVVYPGGNSNTIGVGATAIDDSLSYISSMGPSILNNVTTMKPDVTAPGENITSASVASDDGYRGDYTGTSMAAPHVAGVLVLLKGRDPLLSVEEARSYLVRGCEQEALTGPGENCDGIDETVFPNNVFGHGRVNALESLRLLAENRSKVGRRSS